MLNAYDVNVILRFEKGFPADLFIRCIQLVEQAVYNSELMELKLLFEETVSFFDMPSNKAEDLFHKMLDELAQYKGQTLRIERASEGSIEFVSVVIDLALSLIRRTFGESIKDAWKKTNFHKKIREVLLRKVEDIGENIEGATRDDDDLISNGVNVEVKTRKDVGENELNVKIMIQISLPANRKLLPTKGEIISEILKRSSEQKGGKDGDFSGNSEKC